jgi:hypothetical protein
MRDARASAPTGRRWRDVDGTPIFLFCEVEQVADEVEPSLLGSRLGQRGYVVGRGLDSLYVCGPGNQVISVLPHLLRVLDDAAAGTLYDRSPWDYSRLAVR